MSVIGNKGRFSERIKKIAINRNFFYRKKKSNDDNSNFIKNKFIKFTFAPVMILFSGINRNSKNNEDNIKNDILINNNNIVNSNEIKILSISDDDKILSKNNELNTNNDLNIDKRKNSVNDFKRYDINFSDVDISKKNSNVLVNDISNNLYKGNSIDSNDVKELSKDIFNSIRKKIIKYYNEFEILSSDLFILSQLGYDEVYLDECKEKIKEIKIFLSKINSLKDKYDYLKSNYDFSNIDELDDKFLIEKITRLKDISSDNDIKKLGQNYKLINEFQYLYLKIDKLDSDVIKLSNYKEDKKKELKKRDIDFDKFKDKVYDVSQQSVEFERFNTEQEKMLKDLDSKINQIDSYKKTEYKLKVFRQLVGNSFKYLGLLLMNPLKGVIPSIATQTVITRGIVRNLYSNLSMEEYSKMVYYAEDYNILINNAIDDISLMSSMIDETISNIHSLKSKYMDEFGKYSSEFVEYRDTIKKLNKIENSVINNKIKLSILANNMKVRKEVNNKKLVRVQELNNKNS